MILPIDPYLIPGASFKRLYDEYLKYKSLHIGYDFDDTVHDYHKRGSFYPLVIQLLMDLKSIGCTLTCWTAYKDLEYVAEYLTRHEIPFDDINGDGIRLPWTSRKPFFSTVLDDRIGLAQVYGDLSQLVHLIKNKS